MSATWISVIVAGVVAAVAIVTMISTAATMLLRAGRHEGKIEQILENLTDLVADHETRLRAQERRPSRR